MAADAAMTLWVRLQELSLKGDDGATCVCMDIVANAATDADRADYASTLPPEIFDRNGLTGLWEANYDDLILQDEMAALALKDAVAGHGFNSPEAITFPERDEGDGVAAPLQDAAGHHSFDSAGADPEPSEGTATDPQATQPAQEIPQTANPQTANPQMANSQTTNPQTADACEIFATKDMKVVVCDPFWCHNHGNDSQLDISPCSKTREAIRTKTWLVARYHSDAGMTPQALFTELMAFGFHHLSVAARDGELLALFKKDKLKHSVNHPDGRTLDLQKWPGDLFAINTPCAGRASIVEYMVGFLGAWLAKFPVVVSNFKVVQNVAIQDYTDVAEVLYKLRGLTDIALELAIAQAINAKAHKRATDFQLTLVACAASVRRILQLERGDRPSTVVYLNQNRMLNFDTDFDADALKNTKATYWDEDAQQFVVSDLREVTEQMLYWDRSFVLSGLPNCGKTRLALALARRVLLEARCYNADGSESEDRERYAIMVKTIDVLKDLSSIMRKHVPVIMDEVTPSDHDTQGDCEPDKLKTLLDVKDGGTTRTRFRDLNLADLQPRFWTTNRTTKAQWLPASVPMPATDGIVYNMQHFMRDAFADLRAIERRLVWVEVRGPLLRETTRQQHSRDTQALKERFAQNRQRFEQAEA